ncbi:hypothetical protein [Planococcus sp. CAU13]|uniref:hypothetical protein n=1 Tax=Planococcus sp. CAU13 TaxID=1541197 RepID=UPI0005300916|nr:hypothetical protein [Planococcus sp. CAU13]
MLSLLIIMMLFGTLVPTFQKMQETLHEKQLQLTAYETMHDAAKIIKATGAVSGQRIVNGVQFSWVYGTGLCVSYENYRLSQVMLCEE